MPAPKHVEDADIAAAANNGDWSGIAIMSLQDPAHVAVTLARMLRRAQIERDKLREELTRILIPF